jgi:hypothetical protein
LEKIPAGTKARNLPYQLPGRCLAFACERVVDPSQAQGFNPV